MQVLAYPVENICRDRLLLIAKTFAKANKLALATVSRYFHGSDTFLADFESGKVSITLRKYDEMIARLEKEKWPKPRKKKNSVKNGR